MLRKLICALVLLLPLPGALNAQSAAPDIPDASAGADIAAATTEPRLLSPWVSYLPTSATVPSPRTFLHRIPGTPGELDRPRLRVGSPCRRREPGCRRP
jgi:hypothetical protein